MGSILRSSGFIYPDTKFPFVTIQKISTVLDILDSKNQAEEESIYQFLVFATSREQVLRIRKAIRSRYDYTFLPVRNRNFLGIFWDGGTIREVQSGLYQGIIQYRILAERLITSRINFGITIGDNFLQCIYNRYLASTKLRSQLNGFSTSNFVNEAIPKPPYVTVGDIIESVDAWYTCQQLLEDLEVTFEIWDTEAERAEIIKEDLMDEYNFAEFNIGERDFCKLGYNNDTLTEMESGLWKGTLTYNLLQLKNN